jgi:hypothetical protein
LTLEVEIRSNPTSPFRRPPADGESQQRQGEAEGLSILGAALEDLATSMAMEAL